MYGVNMHMLSKIPSKRDFFMLRLGQLLIGGPFGFNRLLVWGFIVSFVFVSFIDSVKQPLAFNLLVSYMSAYIFYFLTILLPEIDRQFSMVHFLIWKLYKINEPFDHLCSAIGQNRPKDDNFNEWDVFCNSVQQTSVPNYHYFRVFEQQIINGQHIWIHRYLSYQECLETLQKRMVLEIEKMNSIVPFFDHGIMVSVNSFAEKIENLNERINLMQMSSPAVYKAQFTQIMWEINLHIKWLNSLFEPFMSKYEITG